MEVGRAMKYKERMAFVVLVVAVGASNAQDINPFEPKGMTGIGRHGATQEINVPRIEAYTNDGAARKVRINGRWFREGERAWGVTIREIRPGAVVIDGEKQIMIGEPWPVENRRRK